MEGLDIHWRERTGDIIFEKAEWKKSPSDRFRFIAMYSAEQTNLFSLKQREWLESHLFQIPHWETLNPTCLVLGLACFDKKDFSEEKFKKAIKTVGKFPKNLGIRPMDVIRYAKAWDRWFKEKKL